MGHERGQTALGMGTGMTLLALPWQASSLVHQAGKAGVILTSFRPGQNHRSSSCVGLTSCLRAAPPALGRLYNPACLQGHGKGLSGERCGQEGAGAGLDPHPTWRR